MASGVLDSSGIVDTPKQHDHRCCRKMPTLLRRNQRSVHPVQVLSFQIADDFLLQLLTQDHRVSAIALCLIAGQMNTVSA